MTKLTINLSEESMENLEVIHRLTHSVNKTTAFAEALKIARVILEQHQEGKKIIVQDSLYEQELLISKN